LAWFASLDVPWWVSGGWALDLYLGEQTETTPISTSPFCGATSRQSSDP
jgi:hypothetical protein